MNKKSLLLLVLSTSLLGFTAQAKPDGEPGEAKGKRPSPQEIFQRMDSDENGTLSLEEVKGPLAEHFDKIDADGDGQITPKELRIAHQKRLKGEKGPKGEKGQGAERRGPNLKEADSNEDGAISKAEATEAGMERLLEHFDEIDADGNGEITREEMLAMRKGKGPKGPRGPEEEE
ncbi:EF-hand domain-containing protein [Coraliomargarita algicola]|uniref:EF-hand domain-containing protein n=1 Tax=Coraliomargarita algicola TaxID=3092156 RepID=A0ABZ0RK40_9BACT|nr:EF-hand domain-containing protein [Coraliomargarita sp. J2-16]WPJ95634.1 EF-hand domain-containing protein [Coraliomargarita sp. J2-16]